MICVFTRSITGELASLVKQIDDVVEANAFRKLAAFVVFLADEPNAVEAELETLAEGRGITQVPLTVFAGAAGPPNYAIARDAEVTVIMWGGEKKLVRVNHAFGKGKLSEQFIERVVADASATDDKNDAVSVGVFNSRVSVGRLKQLGALADVESLDLQDVDVTAAGLAHLRALTKLRSLNLFRNKKLTDAAVDTLICFKQLEELNISSTQISSAGLARLTTELTELKRLNIRNDRQIDDAGLAALLALPKLEALFCGNTFISDAGLEPICRLTELRELEVRKTRITNAGLGQIKNLPHLENLNCSDNNITTAGVAHLRDLKELRFLDLSQTRINDAALAHLERLAHLQHLDLSRTQLIGEGLSYLHELQKLRFVNLFGTQASEASVEALRKALPNCEIVR